MTLYNDPTVLHAADCLACGRTVNDSDLLDDNGECPPCSDGAAKDAALEALIEAREAMADANAAALDARIMYEITLAEAVKVEADIPAVDWLAVAAGIVGVRQ
jgi:hypothetical protein